VRYDHQAVPRASRSNVEAAATTGDREGVMSIKLQLPKLVDVKPRLTVIGVGGAGCNAVNNMIAAGLQGVEFVVANTDAQSLAASSAEHRLQLGASLTEGLGAGSRPEIGEAAAEEALEEIRSHIAGAHMVFIAAGMGGGTGTGAAAVIARAARELGILTVGIVCKPFQFEGARRMRIADAGVQTLRQHVDTLIVIPNQNLFRIANERTTFAEAFVLADQVLYSGIACIVELVLKEGLINLDFADVRTVMSGMGTAMMGTGEATGERRAILAAEEAIANPLLDDVTLKGAKGLLLSITGGRDLTLYEVDEAASRVRQEVDPEANIIVGATFDENLGDRLRVSIVASGMGRLAEQTQQRQPSPAPTQIKAPMAAPYAQAPQQNHSIATSGFIPYVPAATAPSPVPYAPRIDNDVQRRLAEALENAQPIAAHSSNQYGYLSPSAQHAPPATWTAPGNITIEDGLSHFPQLTGASLGQTPALPQLNQAASQWGTQPDYGRVQGYGQQQGFQPAPPAEFQRSARRMPVVEDFPDVGQRDWHAKQSEPGTSQVSGTESVRSRGFFGRISALGRRSQEAAPAVPMARGAGVDGRFRSDDEAPLPVFFGRERR
jgi:cell division protein FtsZ